MTPTLSDAINAALDALGTSAETDLVRAWVIRHFPEVRLDGGRFGVELIAARRERRAKGG